MSSSYGFLYHLPLFAGRMLKFQALETIINKYPGVIFAVNRVFKGNGDYSEVRDKFCSNFQNMLIRSLLTENYPKKYGVPIHIRKLGGATY